MATDLIQEVADFGFELLGMYGQLTRRSPFRLLDGEMEQAYRAGIFLRFGGGANEVQRDIIARRGLGDAAGRGRAVGVVPRRPLAAGGDGAELGGARAKDANRPRAKPRLAARTPSP